MIKRLRSIATIGLFLVVMPPPIVAQGPVTKVGVSQRVHWESSFRRDSIPPNNWKGGAMLGGGIGLILGGLLYRFHADVDDRTPNVMVFFGPLLIGALIGGMIGAGNSK